jgi:hypothetical protein
VRSPSRTPARKKDELSDRELLEKRFDELERKIDRLAS